MKRLWPNLKYRVRQNHDCIWLYLHILVSVLLSDFWRSPTMTITFLPVSLWETKLTFIWMVSQTHTTAESGQLRTLWLFMKNHCTLSVSQFGVRYTQQMWLVTTSFEDEMGRALTVTGDRYRAMTTTFLAPAVELMTMNQERSLWFQQDGATCHTARESMACLRQLFPDGWFPDMETFLGHPGLQIWQLQIFLWGYLKERVYQTKPRTLQKLKDSIRREILSIRQETLNQWWSVWYGEYSTVWLSVAVTYRKWFSGHNL
jgi:hypothetical protein